MCFPSGAVKASGESRHAVLMPAGGSARELEGEGGGAAEDCFIRSVFALIQVPFSSVRSVLRSSPACFMPKLTRDGLLLRGR